MPNRVRHSEVIVPSKWAGQEIWSSATPEESLKKDGMETLTEGFSWKLRHWHFIWINKKHLSGRTCTIFGEGTTHFPYLPITQSSISLILAAGTSKDAFTAQLKVLSTALLDIPRVVLLIPDLVSIELWLTAVRVSVEARYACPRLCKYIWEPSICQCCYTAIGMGMWGGAITPSVGWQTYPVRQNKCGDPAIRQLWKTKKESVSLGRL